MGETNALALSSSSTLTILTGSSMFLSWCSSEIIEGEIQLVLDLLIHVPSHVDAAGLGRAFKACCQVYAVSVYVIAFNNDVTDVDPDAISHLIVFRHASVFGPNKMLNFYGATDGFNGTGEFDQQTIAHQFDDAPVPSRQNGFDYVFAVLFDGRQDAGFIFSNQAAVANDVSG